MFVSIMKLFISPPTVQCSLQWHAHVRLCKLDDGVISWLQETFRTAAFLHGGVGSTEQQQEGNRSETIWAFTWTTGDVVHTHAHTQQESAPRQAAAFVSAGQRLWFRKASPLDSLSVPSAVSTAPVFYGGLRLVLPRRLARGGEPPFSDKRRRTEGKKKKVVISQAFLMSFSPTIIW